MALLNRSDWYDLARETNWTPKYVKESELYPEELSGARGIPESGWASYDEPYKVSFREYVEVQREKDAGAYSVKAALERMDMYNSADPGWISTLKEHYIAVSVVEYHAALQNSRMTRFSRAAGMRNTATFGMLDGQRRNPPLPPCWSAHRDRHPPKPQPAPKARSSVCQTGNKPARRL